MRAKTTTVDFILVSVRDKYWYAVFSPLLLIFFATDNYLSVRGKEKLSMWLGVATQEPNIVLDLIFIVFLGWGARQLPLQTVLLWHPARW